MARAYLRLKNCSLFNQKIADPDEANPKAGWLKRGSGFLEKGRFCGGGTFSGSTKIAEMEKQFLLGTGNAFAYLKSLGEKECNRFIVEILSAEGLESSRIEGEILDRESLQSSIKQHFGLAKKARKRADKESGMAELLLSVYETFHLPLTHKMLSTWHSMLFTDQSHISDSGKYRTHAEPMQIVSNRYDSSVVFFEPPPSAKVFAEMQAYIDWFNNPTPTSSTLGRAAIAHIYFESIHPFEDGNGRIGRILVEKILSQGVGRSVLIAVSKVLENEKKTYYSELEKCNRTLEIQDWVEYFAQAILRAQEESVNLLYFLIKKSKMLIALSRQLNSRQEKALLRMFAEGPTGFKGGLSAENYISITGVSRATATRDLADLVRKEALLKTGELRHTRYWLNL
ncbi:MAG: Adenosine monophosphate-protein transferase SoFic [Chlamydiae bacterium]|nr:Adenosine monophosphate-protein transferase SoFic [Chlamydiota bacterium]